MRSKLLSLTMIGSAWPFLGLGYLVIHFKYFPTGLELVGQALGLFLAGLASGALFFMFRRGMQTPAGKLMIILGYILVAPLGVMLGLLAPSTLIGPEAPSVSIQILAAPLLTAFYASLVMAVGLGVMGGLGLMMKGMAEWRAPQPELVPLHVKIRR